MQGGIPEAPQIGGGISDPQDSAGILADAETLCLVPLGRSINRPRLCDRFECSDCQNRCRRVLILEKQESCRGMTDTPETSREGPDARESAGMNAPEVDAWFACEVLPLEAALMQFLQHNWRNRSDVADLRQDVYVLVYEAALKQIPDKPKQFVFATARNLLANRVKREQIVPIEAVADLDALDVAIDTPSPDRQVIARDELKHLQTALDRLTPRCREAVVLGRIEGLSGVQIAERMGIGQATVSKHLTDGLAALADMIHGEAPTKRVKS